MSEPCWCGRDHSDTHTGDYRMDLNNALTTVGHEYARALYLPQIVNWLASKLP